MFTSDLIDAANKRRALLHEAGKILNEFKPEFRKQFLESVLSRVDDETRSIILEFSPVEAYCLLNKHTYGPYSDWFECIVFVNKEGYEKIIIVSESEGCEHDAILVNYKDSPFFDDIGIDIVNNIDIVLDDFLYEVEEKVS